MMFTRSPLDIHPTLLAYWSDKASAQTEIKTITSPPQTPQTGDPLTSYGVAIALLFSVGSVLVGLFKGYVSTVSKRSEIELKAQESQNQRSQDVATIMMKQQESFVANLLDAQKADRERLELLTKAVIETQIKTVESLDVLSELIRSQLKSK